MLILEVSINNHLIAKETAVRIKGTADKSSVNTDELSDGCLIKHKHGDGGLKLAKKMIDHLEMAKVDEQ